MGRTVETKLLLTGEDRASKTFENVERKARQTAKALEGFDKATKAAKAVDSLTGALDRNAKANAVEAKAGATVRAFDNVAKGSDRMADQVVKDFQRTSRALDLTDTLRRDLKMLQLTNREIGILARDAAKMGSATQAALGGIANDKVRAQIVAAERATMEARLRERAQGLSQARQLEEKFARELGGNLRDRERAFKEHHSRMGRIVRDSAAYLGAGSAVYTGARAVRNAYTQGADTHQQRELDRQAGLKPADVKRIEERAFALSLKYKSISANTFHESLRDKSMSMGSVDKASELGDTIGASTVVLQSLKGKEAAVDESRRFFAGLDTAGKNVDPKEVRQIMDGWIKALQVQGVDLNLGDFLQFVRQSRSAGASFSTEFLATVAPAAIPDFGGARFGTALASSLSQNVADRATKEAIGEQTKLGMRDRRGNMSKEDMSLIMTDPFAYSEQRLIPLLEKSGINTKDNTAVTKRLSQLFSNRTVYDAFTKFITQREQYKRMTGQFREAQGLDAAEGLGGRDPYEAAREVAQQWNNVMTKFTDPAIPAAIAVLNTLSSSLAELAKFADKNPGAAVAGATGAAVGTVVAGKKAYDLATGGFGLRKSALDLSGSALALTRAAAALGGSDVMPDASGDGADKKGRKGGRRRGGGGGRSILGGFAGAMVGGLAAGELAELLGDESGWLTTAGAGATALAAWAAPVPTLGAAAAAAASEAAAKADPSGITNDAASDPMLMTGGAGLAGRVAELVKAHLEKDVQRGAAIAPEDPRDLATLGRDQAALRKRLDTISTDRATLPGGESTGDLDAIEAELKAKLDKIALLIVRRSADAGLGAFDGVAMPTRSTGYRGVPIPPMRPALEEALRDARPVGEAAGKAAGDGVADGIQSKAPVVRNQALEFLRVLQAVYTANPIRIPMSLDPSGLGGLGGSGGAGGGGGLINASYGGGGGLQTSGGSSIPAGVRGGNALFGRDSSPGGGGTLGGAGGGPVRPLRVGAGAGVGHVASQTERAAYIREAAIRNGIDPDVALRVAQSEGFYRYTGDQGRSFGDFQLFTGGGLGNIALRRGINVRDPGTWKAQTDFAMEIARKQGWKPWYGARKAGIGNRQGIGGRPIGDPKLRADIERGAKDGTVHGRRDEVATPEAPRVPGGGAAPSPAAPAVPSTEERLNVLYQSGGQGDMVRAAADMRAAVDRFAGMRLNTLHTIELTGGGRDGARVKGMRATSEGPISADMGISMPQTRSTRPA